MASRTTILSEGRSEGLRPGFWKGHKSILQQLPSEHSRSIAPQRLPSAMIPIGSRLYLGDIDALAELASKPDVTVVLSLLTPPHSSYPSLQKLPEKYNHLAIELSDTPTASLLAILPAALSFLQNQLSSNNGVLVHCLHGRSRSSATALAYLLYTSQQRSESPEACVEEAVHQLRQSYSNAAPSDSFTRQLVAFAERLPISPRGYVFPGEPAWRVSAGPLERAEVYHCLLHAWPNACAPDALIWDSLLLPNPSQEDSLARCRRCRVPLLSRASLGLNNISRNPSSRVIEVMPLQWIGACVTLQSAGKRADSGRLRCPGCQSKVGTFNRVGAGGFPTFVITVSAVDFFVHGT